MSDREKMFEAKRDVDGAVIFTVRPPKLDMDATPGSPVSHLLASQKEMLLAFRSLLDGAISFVDKAGASNSERRTRIDID